MEIKVLKNILEENESWAEKNQKLFQEKGIFAINLMSAPGSGKTELLNQTIEALKNNTKVAVIEGDVATTEDSERLKRHGIPIIQINTEPFGGECHLEAHLIASALKLLDLNDIDILFIENMGNLVCPAEFKLGVHKNVVLLSVPEGEDKPLKYPQMFRIADLLLINKIDLLPHIEFNREKLLRNVKKIKPRLEVLQISAKKKQGLENWMEWIRTHRS